MRALRVVGLHEDGKSIVLEDPASRTRFLLPADERLRAAARGDITRLGQIEIELESQMRPREIQQRIRAGESVEQVAAGAGVTAQRVERYAYPVLLERSRTAELAQSAHPVREDGPDVQTLGEVIAYAFGVRGHDYSTVRALDPARDAEFQPTLDSVEPIAAELPAVEPDPDDDTREIPRVPAEDEEDTAAVVPQQPEPATRPKTKKNHPIVPSWEDVLLGVRSQRG